ncbi:class I SAM-dependent methyltransferase [Nocardioides mesophilus]|uniref:Methyltransferase domain-containing protein n=1 Tax=Nocardioides mesophilus TaxID=433659 RepID=A0A7G9RG82_9ACTN|nr:class I SAM-dependent methyltransferase [Nocardioides mesophilus]QNN54607.1 methyltransferase domain-containing protein [Nocardioides mesophilus]
MTDEPLTRWQQLSQGLTGDDYQARFAELAARGEDVHGEASFVSTLVGPGARLLDAGCGTGRVAIRLAELGYDVVGVDVEESMLAVARRERPATTWLRGDLADLPAGVVERAPYDLVLMAGNVVPLLAPGTLPAAVAGLVATLRPDGLLVAGFGLDRLHLPQGCPVTPLEEYDEAAEASGLRPVDRFSTWQAAPYAERGGYVVRVHRRDR